MQKQEKIIEILEKEYPEAGTRLRSKNTVQMLVAVMLSAQCTDERVNKVTEKLFKKYRTAKDFASANRKTLEREIFSTGYYHNKARNIIACCKMLEEKYCGKVPMTMEELVEVPGIGRKTANVVLQHEFGVTQGITVDTHVGRLAQRLGFSKNKSPEKIERDLMNAFDRKHWLKLSDILIFHGRKVCNARKPMCGKCAVNRLCPSAFSFGGVKV